MNKVTCSCEHAYQLWRRHERLGSECKPREKGLQWNKSGLLVSILSTCQFVTRLLTWYYNFTLNTVYDWIP